MKLFNIFAGFVLQICIVVHTKNLKDLCNNKEIDV